MSISWYDRKGNLLPSTTKAEMHAIEELLSNVEYKRVAQTTLPDGKWISTVWLGLNHSFTPGTLPLIFETMVFPSHDKLSELDSDRYTTEAEALAGHAQMVEKWSKPDASS